MSQSLRKTEKHIINLTNRFDLNRKDFVYSAYEIGDEIHCKFGIWTWARLRDVIEPHHDLSVSFSRTGQPERNLKLGKAHAAIIRSGGEFSCKMPGGFDPADLRASIIISDPEDLHRIVMRTSMTCPDVTSDDRREPTLKDIDKVSAFRNERGADDGILEVVEIQKHGHVVDVDLSGDTVRLVIAARLGKERFNADRTLKGLYLPEVFRRVLTALVKEADRYDDATWAEDWKNLAARMSPTRQWEYFTGEELDCDEDDIDARIADGVNKFASDMPESIVTADELNRFDN
jgi:hypothetical protein